jgi:UDPglucose 6-dehydrogenase
VAILGTSFKANTDDVREAAALTIVPLLIEAGLDVHAHDPQPGLAKQLLGKVHWHDSALTAARDADVTVILTEWEQYRTLDLRQLAGAMRGRVLLDFRNILPAEQVARAGLHYRGLGRPAAGAKSAHRGQGSTPGLRVAASPA